MLCFSEFLQPQPEDIDIVDSQSQDIQQEEGNGPGSHAVSYFFIQLAVFNWHPNIKCTVLYEIFFVFKPFFQFSLAQEAIVANIIQKEAM